MMEDLEGRVGLLLGYITVMNGLEVNVCCLWCI